MTTARLLPPRIPLVDAGTGNIAREWYLYFLALAGDVGTNSSGVAGLITDFAGVNVALTGIDSDIQALEIAPSSDVGGIAAAMADTQQYGVEPSTASLAARVAALESIVNDLRLGVPVL